VKSTWLKKHCDELSKELNDIKSYIMRINKSYVSVLDAALQGFVHNHLLKVSSMAKELLINRVVGGFLFGWSPGLWFVG